MVLTVFWMNFGFHKTTAKTVQMNASRRTAASKMEKCCVSKSVAIEKRATDAMLAVFHL